MLNSQLGLHFLTGVPKLSCNFGHLDMPPLICICSCHAATSPPDVPYSALPSCHLPHHHQEFLHVTTYVFAAKDKPLLPQVTCTAKLLQQHPDKWCLKDLPGNKHTAMLCHSLPHQCALMGVAPLTQPVVPACIASTPTQH